MSDLRPLGDPLSVELPGGARLECSAYSSSPGAHDLRLEIQVGASPPLIVEGPRQMVAATIIDPLLYAGELSLHLNLVLPLLYVWVAQLPGWELPSSSKEEAATQPKRAPTPPRGVVTPTPLPACPPTAPVVREELEISEEYLAPYRVEVEVEVLPGDVALMRAHLCEGVILLAFSPDERRSWPQVSWEIGQAVDAWYAEAPGGPPHVFNQSGLRYTLQTYAHSRLMIHENSA